MRPTQSHASLLHLVATVVINGQTQGQRGDLHQNSHPHKINRDRGIELLAESMDANLELASDDPWAPFQETEN